MVKREWGVQLPELPQLTNVAIATTNSRLTIDHSRQKKYR